MSGIYRNERTSLSISGESAAGAYADASQSTGQTNTDSLNGATSAGARSVVLTDATGYGADDYIQFEVDSHAHREIRRIRRVSSNTVYLDYPLFFAHGNGIATYEIPPASVVATGTSYLTHFPGVYDQISVPDMTAEIIPAWFLGTSSARNPFVYYRGRQAFQGSLPSFRLLNGVPLRFPFGTVATTGTDSGTGGSTTSADTVKGDLRLPVTDGTGYANNDYIQIGTGTTAEVRQIISGASGAGAQTFVLSHPMMFAHSSGATLNEVTSPYTHTITETVNLDSMTWHVLYRDADGTAANDMIHRFVGGKVNRATISAQEGEVVRMGWDDVVFLDMVHNQRYSSAVGGGATELVKYSSALIAPTVSFPTTEPYYFSQGAISLFGVTFGRIRNFQLEVNNNLTPQYYIRDQATERTPAEIIEQRREHRMGATIALPDSAAASSSTARTLFKELIQEGLYASAMQGFDISITLTRGTNDTITITIPPVTATTGGDANGAFITRAHHNIGQDSPISVPVDISFRAVSITIQDSVAVYP